MNQLDQIEKRLKELFENSTAGLLWQNQNAILAHRLCLAVQEFLLEETSDGNLTPSRFQITLNPNTLKDWQSDKNWEAILITALTETSIEFGFQFENTPSFTLVAKNSLQGNEIEIEVIPQPKPTEQTGAIPIDPGIISAPQSIDQSSDASLIMEDETTLPLTGSVINLGRKSDNHLVLKDLRVSRTHAQIRKTSEGYLLFDVGSTGGTFVNGDRINQYKLRPGDVISLAGYKMIFVIEHEINIQSEKKSTSEIKTISEEEEA